jgi:peptide-methionine (S)-S-oxide reductase
MEITTLGGGCFWCLEAVFARLTGVDTVQSGYTGGSVLRPTYDQVCTGTTGHAEVVQITFDPALIAFKGILEVFFNLHDPTTLNRQGADRGTQYRSVIFYHTEIQKETAYQVIQEIHAAGVWAGPIVTEVTPLDQFYPAEEYHQRYYDRNPSQGYCRAVIGPKVKKLQERFGKRLKT